MGSLTEHDLQVVLKTEATSVGLFWSNNEEQVRAQALFSDRCVALRALKMKTRILNTWNIKSRPITRLETIILETKEL